MKGREELCEDMRKIREIISTYKVLKLEQIYKTISDKEPKVRRSIITMMKNAGTIFVFDDICSATDNWVKNLDKSLIVAFWILLDFWNEVLFNTTATFPAKIDFITQEDSFDIIVAEKGHEKMLNVFFIPKTATPQSNTLLPWKMKNR